MTNNFIFIFTRHVNNEQTNEYWQECYTCIRQFYENKIMIVDDDSNYEYVKSDIVLVNCDVIQSEFPRRGELLAYYYFCKSNYSGKAVVIHDSVFIKKYIPFYKLNKNKFIWSFEGGINEDDNDELSKLILPTIAKFKNDAEIMDLYVSKKWTGCYGCMAILDKKFICDIDMRYNFFNTVIENVKTRRDRCVMERIFALVCHLNSNNFNKPLLDNIHKYCRWGVTYNEYKNNYVDGLPIVKVWSGR